MKLTVKNVIDIWFAEDTPVRQYRIRMNPRIWEMCQLVSRDFKAPSGRLLQKQYRKSDKVAFAKLVLAGLDKAELSSKSAFVEMAY